MNILNINLKTKIFKKTREITYALTSDTEQYWRDILKCTTFSALNDLKCHHPLRPIPKIC